MQDATLWSHQNPKLYNMEVLLTESGTVVDQVGSYFGMRKISLGKDADGRTRILLNIKKIERAYESFKRQVSGAGDPPT